MTMFYDKYSLHHVLIQPVKWLGHPTVEDKMQALHSFKLYGDTNDIPYVYPLVFDKNIELASVAAHTVAGIMRKVQGEHWNRVYDEVKYTAVNIEMLGTLLKYPPEISVNLLGIASLNRSGYIREKALALISEIQSPSAIPYILLRLNDWVLPVRNLAVHVLRESLTSDNVEIFIDNAYLIDKLKNVLRVDLKSTRQQIVDYLTDDSLRGKIKIQLKHPHVKTRLFCYMLLTDAIAYEEDIIHSALKDKSFEIRIWLVKMIGTLEYNKRNEVIGKLLQDKSAKVKVAALRSYGEIIYLEFSEKLKELVSDDYASVRDEARFMTKKYSLIKDFPEFYRYQILSNPLPGALLGLGETGNKNDFSTLNSFATHKDPKIRMATMAAMWYLSKEQAARFVLDSLDSEVPRIKKIARRLLKKEKMFVVLLEMKERLKSDNTEIQLFALDIIHDYGGWHALEGILFAILNKKGPVLEKAKKLLGQWLLWSSRFYSRPDHAIRDKIVDYFEHIRDKEIICSKTLREVQFVIDAIK